MTVPPFRIGARGSRLSLIQASLVRAALLAAYPDLPIHIEVITTTGDRLHETPLPELGGDGAFTLEIESALHAGRIDIAVHSLKDLPVRDRPGLTIGATLPRAEVADGLVSRNGEGLTELRHGAVIGTSSPRRAAQLRAFRGDLDCRSIRGNVETRLRKGMEADGQYDAIVLARAGLDRLGLGSAVTETIPLDLMLPAPGQGAIAVQSRADGPAFELAGAIDHPATGLATAAERAFLDGLGGGCSAPIAAFGRVTRGLLRLQGRVLTPDGAERVDLDATMPCDSVTEAIDAGRRLASEAIGMGADRLLLGGCR